MPSNSTDAGIEGPRTVKVSVVQAAPALFDTPRTLQKLADLTADAARRGAGLVVFPEAYVAGYPKGHDFGVTIGQRSPRVNASNLQTLASQAVANS